MSTRRSLIITLGNEGTETGLEIRQALVSEFQKLENVPAALYWLALNTDDPRDEKYPASVRLDDPEKLALKVENLQNLVFDETNYGYLTKDLPTQLLLSENTTRGSARIPSQGMLAIRCHHEDFVARLQSALQQLYDPTVFPDAGELCVVVIASGCTGTGRGTAPEVLVEVKRQLNASTRPHRILTYILSPEGLAPEDLHEKQKVFYAFMKELNGLALGETYSRPFLSDPQEQTWSGSPTDYVFLVSARSRSIHLPSLQQVKQAIVYHVLYELTSSAGERMESARRDCVLRLKGFDGCGQPTFLSLLGLSMIDLPVRMLKQLCLAQGGLELCRIMLGQEPESVDARALLTTSGLSLSQVSDVLGHAPGVSRIGAIFAKITEELGGVRPNQWGDLITSQGPPQCESLLSSFRQSIPKRTQAFITQTKEQLESEARAQATAFGTIGLRPTLARLKAVIAGLGVHEGDEGLIQQITNQISQASETQKEKRERISRCRQRLAEAGQGVLARIGFNPPTEARDAYVEAMHAYYRSELTIAVQQAGLEVYRVLGNFLVGLTRKIETPASTLSATATEFEQQLLTIKAASDFPLTEYLIAKTDYKRLYDQQIGPSELETAAQELLTAFDGDLFALGQSAAYGLKEKITECFQQSKRFGFIDTLSFEDYFEMKYRDNVAQETAIRQAFGRAVPLTITDANYPRSTTGVTPEAHQLVLIPQEAFRRFSGLIAKTHPIPQDNLLAVPEKRLLIIREEHGWPVWAIPYLRNECAARYKKKGTNHLKYHISKWATDYSDPVPLRPLTPEKLTAPDLLLLAMVLGVISKDDSGFAYDDAGIDIQLGETFEAALEALESDVPQGGESDYDALYRLTLAREEKSIQKQELRTLIAKQSKIWSEFARPIRDLVIKRYGPEK